MKSIIYVPQFSTASRFTPNYLNPDMLVEKSAGDVDALHVHGTTHYLTSTILTRCYQVQFTRNKFHVRARALRARPRPHIAHVICQERL